MGRGPCPETAEQVALAFGVGIAYDTAMAQLTVVLDTNVVVSGLRSRRGASFQLLSMIGQEAFELCLSVPLILEYEEVLTRQADELFLDIQSVGVVLDYFCQVGRSAEVYFLWRPRLRDPGDDMVLEAAVAGQCDYIVTHNLKDFAESASFGIPAISPKDLLHDLRGLP